jgi:hypothetical protein
LIASMSLPSPTSISAGHNIVALILQPTNCD